MHLDTTSTLNRKESGDRAKKEGLFPHFLLPKALQEDMFFFAVGRMDEHTRPGPSPTTSTSFKDEARLGRPRSGNQVFGEIVVVSVAWLAVRLETLLPLFSPLCCLRFSCM